ncbi:MAG: serine hydrolase domain-containing protein [Gelidibacter sp.]
MKKTIHIVIFLLCTTLSFAQLIDTSKLDSLFSILEKNDKFMGSIAVSQNQKTIYLNAIGYTDIENGVKANNTSKYRVGSISKIFTASLIFKAIEERKLKLDQTIDKFFPNIKNADIITIENLLNHSSGIHDFTREADYYNWNVIFQSKERMLERISNGISEFKPNEKSDYSNSNYVLLTFILEQIYNQPFSKILDKHIIKPLKLQNTYYGKKTEISKNESYSYKYVGKWIKESETDMSVPQGAGALISNPTDLNTFVEQLFLGNLVTEKSLENMKTIKNGYGMGLFQFPYNDKESFGHTGGIDGFESVTSYFPQDKLAITLTSNGVNYNKNTILLAVLALFYNDTFELHNFERPKLTSDDLDKFLGTYSSEQIPINIVVTKEGNTLVAQATGQVAFSLESTSENVFIYDRAGIKIEFMPSEKTMILYQGGGEYKFTAE